MKKFIIGLFAELKSEPFAIFMIGLVVGVILMGIAFLIG